MTWIWTQSGATPGLSSDRSQTIQMDLVILNCQEEDEEVSRWWNSILSWTLKNSSRRCDHHDLLTQRSDGIRRRHRERRFDEKRRETKCVWNLQESLEKKTKLYKDMITRARTERCLYCVRNWEQRPSIIQFLDDFHSEVLWMLSMFRWFLPRVFSYSIIFSLLSIRMWRNDDDDYCYYYYPQLRVKLRLLWTCSSGQWRCSTWEHPNGWCVGCEILALSQDYEWNPPKLWSRSDGTVNYRSNQAQSFSARSKEEFDEDSFWISASTTHFR